MKKLTVLTALIMAAVMIITFTACGTDAPAGETTTDPETVTAADATATAANDTETSTQEETQTQPTETTTAASGKTNGTKSDTGKTQGGSGSDNGGSSGGSGSGNGGAVTPTPKPNPTPAPAPKPEFNANKVIEMVHQKVKANPDIDWVYDLPGVTPNEHTYMGWLEVPYIEVTKTMEQIAQDLYEDAVGEHNRNNQNTMFYIEYLGLNSEGNHRFKLYRA